MFTYLADLFDDAELIVRKNVHMTLEMLSENEIGAEEIINSDKLIGRLIDKIQVEPDEIKVGLPDGIFLLLLSTKSNCYSLNWTDLHFGHVAFLFSARHGSGGVGECDACADSDGVS